MTTTDNINYYSDFGKVFIRKSDNTIMGIFIGISSDNDNINNYTEIDCPEEYKYIDGYDNTVPIDELKLI